MARIVDTIPSFDSFARKAALESPLRRDIMWKERYEGEYPEIFSAFSPFASSGGRQAVARELNRVRGRALDAAPLVTNMIEEIDAAVPGVIGVAPPNSPVHVLMIGHFSTNAAVGRVNDDVAVFHCLEWFQSPEGAKVLVAHETTHAWHQLSYPTLFPEEDLAWTAFYEGLAIEASRQLAPGQAEIDYFWYGHPEVEDWLPWCEEHRSELFKHFRASLDIPEAVETFFGGGLVDGKWRVGFYVADQLVKSLDRPLPELAAMAVDDAQAAIVSALENA